MSDYWLGVLSIPAALVALAVASVVIRWLLVLTGKASVRLVRTRLETTEQQRAHFPSVAYATRRSWFLTVGDFGIAVFAGQRPGEVREAYSRLVPKRSLGDIQAPTTEPAPLPRRGERE